MMAASEPTHGGADQPETAATTDQETEKPVTTATPVAPEAPQGDLLATLENRWTSLADTIKTLRSDKAALQKAVQELTEQLEERAGQLNETTRQLEKRTEELTTSSEALTQTRHNVVALEEEKAQTVSRIEALLARFDEIGQSG
ncbi:MAG: hypothetical protein HQL52_17540 [Magnetococcales bacterium]|nr:hypothetical protein [Magnetococcales bacterium]